MKTYVQNAIQGLQNFSQTQDAKVLLCSKSWRVFNDEGIKELYIFKPDGKLLISCNGTVAIGTWEWIPINHTVLISNNGTNYMLHPQYVDNVILALNVDGTNKYTFLIDESDTRTFTTYCLPELNSYFVRKEEEKRERARLEEERKRVEEERRRQETLRLQEETKKKAEEQSIVALKEQATELKKELEYKSAVDTVCSVCLKLGFCWIWTMYFIVKFKSLGAFIDQHTFIKQVLYLPIDWYFRPIVQHIVQPLIQLSFFKELFEMPYMGIVSKIIGVIIFAAIFAIIPYAIIIIIIAKFIDKGKSTENNIANWKKAHPDDERNKYL